MSNSAPASGRTVVIVTGPGRSGTSSMAGALKLLGYHVPQPEVPARPSNPRGYFEPRWVVDFHNRQLRAAGIYLTDARPEALDKATEVGARARPRSVLTTWLGEAFAQHPHLVIKDPRAFWFRELWAGVAASLGAELSFVTMMRHPAESVGSRLTQASRLTTGPGADDGVAQPTRYLAGWVNVALINERGSRPYSRAFVRYADLMGDWRATMRSLQQTLGLRIEDDLSGPETGHHPVDDFIDPSLRRDRSTLDDLDVPGWLGELGEQVWQGFAEAAEPTLRDPALLARFDELQARYASKHAESVAIARDAINAAMVATRKEERRKAAEERDREQASDESTPQATGAAVRRTAQDLRDRTQDLRDRAKALSSSPRVRPVRRAAGRVLRAGRRMVRARR